MAEFFFYKKRISCVIELSHAVKYFCFNLTTKNYVISILTYLFSSNSILGFVVVGNFLFMENFPTRIIAHVYLTTDTNVTWPSFKYHYSPVGNFNKIYATHVVQKLTLLYSKSNYYYQTLLTMKKLMGNDNWIGLLNLGGQRINQ